MRHLRSIMGMPVQLEIVDDLATKDSYENIFEYFMAVDERFSTYKDTSEISQINRGELREDEYSDEMREVLLLSEETSKETDGYFDIHTKDGSLDPSGLVKGWAINNAATMLKKEGFKNFYVEVAGDIQTSGYTASGEKWSIGIRNPFAKEEIVKVLYPNDKGIATSGTYVRGSHIYNPHDYTSEVKEYSSLTVIGPNVYEADRFVTAVFVMGEKGLYFLEEHDGFEAYAIDYKGMARMTSGFERYTTI